MISLVPPRLIRGPHLQTVLSSVGLRRARVWLASQAFRNNSQDEVADCGDGVRLLMHHTPPADQRTQRTVALFHGWEGSASSTYLLATATLFWSAGFRVFRVNLRDHGPSHHLNEELFHSCRLPEAIGAVRWIRGRFPDDELIIGGYSLGGNFCLRIAASPESEDLRIARVLAICPVLDPVQTMYALDGGWAGYRQYFLRKWRRSLGRKRIAFPTLYDFDDLENFATIGAMTEHFVEHYTEFPDLMTYLRGYALIGDRLRALHVPSDVVLARDDPIIPVDDAARLAPSRLLNLMVQEYGGHCGFLSNYRLDTWLDHWLLNRLGQSR